jgi:hypothetical protein
MQFAVSATLRARNRPHGMLDCKGGEPMYIGGGLLAVILIILLLILLL